MIFDEEDEGAGAEIGEGEREAIRKSAAKWARSLGAIATDVQVHKKVAWRPHLYCAKKGVAIHVLLYPRVQESIAEGFSDAQRRVRDLRIVLVGPETFLREPAVLETAARNGIAVTLLKGQGLQDATDYQNVYSAIAGEGLMLPEGVYKSLAKRALDTALQATRRVKGRALEAALGLMISQVPGFRVVESNYNTATEEIDVVVENRRVGGIFRSLSEPLILVECKNQEQKAGKNEYVSFVGKMRNRRQSVSVGFFISVSGYTQDFRLEGLRDSRERLVVVRFDRKQLETWIVRWGEQAGVFVEERVRTALLE